MNLVIDITLLIAAAVVMFGTTIGLARAEAASVKYGATMTRKKIIRYSALTLYIIASSFIYIATL